MELAILPFTETENTAPVVENSGTCDASIFCFNLRYVHCIRKLHVISLISLLFFFVWRVDGVIFLLWHSNRLIYFALVLCNNNCARATQQNRNERSRKLQTWSCSRCDAFWLRNQSVDDGNYFKYLV